MMRAGKDYEIKGKRRGRTVARSGAERKQLDLVAKPSATTATSQKKPIAPDQRS